MYFSVENELTLLLPDVSVLVSIVPLHNTNSYSSCCAIQLLDSSTSPNLKQAGNSIFNLARMIPETIIFVFHFSYCVFDWIFFFSLFLDGLKNL